MPASPSRGGFMPPLFLWHSHSWLCSWVVLVSVGAGLARPALGFQPQ